MLIQIVKYFLFVVLIANLCSSGSAYGSDQVTPSFAKLGVTSDFDPTELTSRGIYDFVTAAAEGRSIGEMILDIEEAPQRAYDVLESAVFTAAYAIRPQDDEMIALMKVDVILFEHMRFKRGLPGTTFTDALMNGILDCSDATIVFLSAGERAGRDWRAALAPFHMFVAAREGGGSIYWETQEGGPLDVADMIAFHGLRRELIDAGVYLNVMTVRHHVAEAYRNMGGILVRDGDPGTAVEHLNRSLWLWPDHPPTLIWRGYAYALQDDLQAAEADYSKALDIDPFDWVANYHLAALFSELGREADARRYMSISEQYRPANARWVLEEALPVSYRRGMSVESPFRLS